MTLPRTSTGEVMHPSGATRPLAVVLTFPEHRSEPVDPEPPLDSTIRAGSPTVARLSAPHPDGADAIQALTFVAGLLSDPRSTLTSRQREFATDEIAALMCDAAQDACHEDPSCAVRDLPGRTAAAALRVIVQRGLIREEWDT